MAKTNTPSEIITIEDEFLAESLKNSREERRANGRMVALIVAVSLIFLAIYHAWIRKSPVLAGALVPALIMLLYGGWVLFLAKREKRRRLLLEQRMGEKLSEKGSEYGTQENLIVQPIKSEPAPKTSTKPPKTPNTTQSNNDPAITPKKKQRREGEVSFSVAPVPVPIHKYNGGPSHEPPGVNSKKLVGTNPSSGIKRPPTDRRAQNHLTGKGLPTQTKLPPMEWNIQNSRLTS